MATAINSTAQITNPSNSQTISNPAANSAASDKCSSWHRHQQTANSSPALRDLFRGTPAQEQALIKNYTQAPANDFSTAISSQIAHIVTTTLTAIAEQLQQIAQSISNALSGIGNQSNPAPTTPPQAAQPVGSASPVVPETPATQTPTNPSLPPTVTTPSGSATPSDPLNFEQKLRELLVPGADGKIYEDQLQHAVVSYQLYQKDPAIETVFLSQYQLALAAGETIEQSTRTALVAVRDQGLITAEDADWVNGLSRRAAQLDSGIDQLSSSASAAGAAEELESAIYIAERTLAGIATGTIEAKPRPLRKS